MLLVKDLMVDLEKGNRAKEVLVESRKQPNEVLEMFRNILAGHAQQRVPAPDDSMRDRWNQIMGQTYGGGL